MSHALMYHGGFDQNRPGLKPGTHTFQGSDGSERVLPDWPRDARGARIGYMEKAGKKFVAVRVADGTSDVVLPNEMVLVPGEHFGYGVHLGPEPTLVEDNAAILKLLEDIIKKNAATSEELLRMRTRLKAGASRKT